MNIIEETSKLIEKNRMNCSIKDTLPLLLMVSYALYIIPILIIMGISWYFKYYDIMYVSLFLPLICSLLLMNDCTGYSPIIIMIMVPMFFTGFIILYFIYRLIFKKSFTKSFFNLKKQ